MRYTKFEKLLEAATIVEDQSETVWLRDKSQWLRVHHTGLFLFELLNARPKSHVKKITFEQAQDLFNLEMRVYGWVSTARY